MHTRPPYKRFWVLLGLSLLMPLLAFAPDWPATPPRGESPRERTATSVHHRDGPSPRLSYNAALHLDRAVLRLQAERGE